MTARAFGLYPAATNLFRRGQADTTTSSGAAAAGSTLSVDTSTPGPISPQSIKVVTSGATANQGLFQTTGTGLGLAAATAVAGSTMFKGVAGASYRVYLVIMNTDASSTTGAVTTFNAIGTWQLLLPISVAVAASKTGTNFAIFVDINGTRAETFWVVNTMLQSGVSVASGYVPTAGGATASRSASRSQETLTRRRTMRRLGNAAGLYP